MMKFAMTLAIPATKAIIDRPRAGR